MLQRTTSWTDRRIGAEHPRWAVTWAVVTLLVTALAVTGCGDNGDGSGAAVTTPPATVTLETTTGAPGTYLVDGSGRALYMWDADREGKSTCYGDCAVDWPPLTVTGEVTTGAGVDASLIGRTTRKDGTEQVTYGGWPLYYFKQDVAPGELAGQGDPGYGAVWWVVSPNGDPLPSPVG